MSDDDSTDNVVYLNNRVRLSKDPVATVCEFAGKIMEDVIIVGQSKDGTIKMMTTIEDVPDIVWYLESAKHSLFSSGIEDSEDYD
tara:strand:+ start:2007 stop:2261 length:255 start_codon:yes stop_codon:yes gene_type:complete